MDCTKEYLFALFFQGELFEVADGADEDRVKEIYRMRDNLLKTKLGDITFFKYLKAEGDSNVLYEPCPIKDK